MDKEKAKQFIKELKQLQKKHGIQITSTYEEEIDYDYEESPYISGVQSYMLLIDNDGNEVIFEDIIYEYFSCQFCGKETDSDAEFCSTTCKKEYENINTTT